MADLSPLFQPLAHAHDRKETELEGGLDFAHDVRLGLAKVLPAFAVGYDHVSAPYGLQHVPGNFAGNSALAAPVKILRTDGHVTPRRLLHGRVKIGERRADDDIAMRGMGHQRLE